MLTNRKDCLPVLAVLLIACLRISTTYGQQEESEKKIPFSEVPPAILTIIERELDAAIIKDIELGTKDGKRVFKVDAEAADGSELELDITEDGTIVKKRIEGEDKPECKYKQGTRKIEIYPPHKKLESGWVIHQIDNPQCAWSNGLGGR